MYPTLETMLDGASWNLFSSVKHLQVKTYLRMGAGGRMDIKVDGVMPRDMSSTVGPLLHPELYKDWVPGLSRSSLIVNLSHFRKLVYLKSLKFPFLTARDVVLLGYGDVYSEDSVMVYLVSVDETGAWNYDEEPAAAASGTAPSSSDDGADAAASAISVDSVGSLTAEGAAANEAAAQEAAEVEGSEGTQQGMHPGWVKGKPASFNYQEFTQREDESVRAGKSVRMKVAGGFLMKALSPKETSVSAFIKIDLMIPMLPNWTVDFLMKHVASQFIKQLDGMAAKFDPGQPLHYYRTAPEHIEVYNKLNRRLSAVASSPDVAAAVAAAKSELRPHEA